MVWQFLSTFSLFLLACQNAALLVEKWSATEAQHRNPFCKGQAIKWRRKKKNDSIYVSIWRNSFHPDYGNSYRAGEHWQSTYVKTALSL